MNVLQTIISAKKEKRRLLAVLLDPEKESLDKLNERLGQINKHAIDFIFVGGSEVEPGLTDMVVERIKELTAIPVVLFPGDYSQITAHADALLFLSLISGNNPEYLINQQVKSVSMLEQTELEVIPTGYILIDGGKKTAVQRISNTEPMPLDRFEEIVDTAKAAVYMGKQLIYLEAGSGAMNPVPGSLLSKIAMRVDIPLIVGGGIRSETQLREAYANGADLVVIGTAFEHNDKILEEIVKNEHIC